MKEELEICVRCLDSKKQIFSKLQKLGFEVKEDFTMIDTFYVKKEIDVTLENSKILLSNYILIREVLDKDISFVIKKKEFNDKGEIVTQSSCKCPIVDRKKGEDFINNLGYKKFLEVKDHNILVSNGVNEIYIQDVKDLGIFLEMEQKNIYSNNCNGNDINEIIENINSYKLNIDKSNYFVNKALEKLKGCINKSR